MIVGALVMSVHSVIHIWLFRVLLQCRRFLIVRIICENENNWQEKQLAPSQVVHKTYVVKEQPTAVYGKPPAYTKMDQHMPGK